MTWDPKQQNRLLKEIQKNEKVNVKDEQLESNKKHELECDFEIGITGVVS